jgi:hypothetical protein
LEDVVAEILVVPNGRWPWIDGVDPEVVRRENAVRVVSLEDPLDMNIMGGERKGIVMSDLSAQRRRSSGRGRKEVCGVCAIVTSDYRLVGWRRKVGRRCSNESSPLSVNARALATK